MTVSTEINHNEYTGNDVTTDFSYTFRIFQKSDLTVEVADLSGNLSVLVLDTDYIVTGAGGYSGGSVILPSPLPDGWQISVSRELPVTQETDLRNQGKFFPEIHEDVFDRLTMLIQQFRNRFSLNLRKPSFAVSYYDAAGNAVRNLRDPDNPQDAATRGYSDRLNSRTTQHADALNRTALRVPETSVSPIPGATERAGKLLSFDAAGQPVTVLPPAGSAADVLATLAAPDGAARIGSRVLTVQQALDEKLSTGGGTVSGALQVTGAVHLGQDVRADGLLRAGEVISGHRITVSSAGMNAHYLENGDIEGQVWQGGSLSRRITRQEVPAGVPLPWPAPDAPEGWLKCNGAAFDKDRFPLLARVYPSGTLPDLRGEFIRGWDDSRNTDPGRNLLSSQEGQSPVSGPAGYWQNTDWNNGKHRKTGFSYAMGTDHGGWDPLIQEYEHQRETRPRNLAFNYIVRAA